MFHVQSWYSLNEIPDGFYVFGRFNPNIWHFDWLSNDWKTLTCFIHLFFHFIALKWLDFVDQSLISWLVVDDFGKNCSLHQCVNKINFFLSVIKDIRKWISVFGYCEPTTWNVARLSKSYENTRFVARVSQVLRLPSCLNDSIQTRISI